MHGSVLSLSKRVHCWVFGYVGARKKRAALGALRTVHVRNGGSTIKNVHRMHMIERITK